MKPYIFLNSYQCPKCYRIPGLLACEGCDNQGISWHFKLKLSKKSVFHQNPCLLLNWAIHIHLRVNTNFKLLGSFMTEYCPEHTTLKRDIISFEFFFTSVCFRDQQRSTQIANTC